MCQLCEILHYKIPRSDVSKKLNTKERRREINLNTKSGYKDSDGGGEKFLKTKTKKQRLCGGPTCFIGLLPVRPC